MTLQRTSLVFRIIGNSRRIDRETTQATKLHVRPRTTTPSGAILPEPTRGRFSILSVICSVVIGLSIGTILSKKIADFLEEKELFVPSDDDDDDD